mmetsp:Transcript_8558/g.19989  ORF Transcript_8558/g.19989 Transcript_8558/m.19989 type:complete len:208 (+) Transcript_8558:110-733(+)
MCRLPREYFPYSPCFRSVCSATLVRRAQMTWRLWILSPTSPKTRRRMRRGPSIHSVGTSYATLEGRGAKCTRTFGLLVMTLSRTIRQRSSLLARSCRGQRLGPSPHLSASSRDLPSSSTPTGPRSPPIRFSILRDASNTSSTRAKRPSTARSRAAAASVASSSWFSSLSGTSTLPRLESSPPSTSLGRLFRAGFPSLWSGVRQSRVR